MQVEHHRRLSTAQNHPIQQVMDAIECPLAAVDVHFLDRFPSHKRGKQSRQAEDVIQVPVCDKNIAQVPEANPGLEDLALGAFAAVDQEAEFIVFNDLCRKPALGRRGRCGSAEKDNFVHCGNYTLPELSVSLARRPAKHAPGNPASKMLYFSGLSTKHPWFCRCHPS